MDEGACSDVVGLCHQCHGPSIVNEVYKMGQHLRPRYVVDDDPITFEMQLLREEIRRMHEEVSSRRLVL